MAPIFRWGKSRRVQQFLSEVRVCVQALSVSLIRLYELRERFASSESEAKSRLEMAVSELRSLQELLKRWTIPLDGLGEEVCNAVRLLESYAVVSGHAGTKFVDDNLERILRATRWCESSISRALQGREIHSAKLLRTSETGCPLHFL